MLIGFCYASTTFAGVGNCPHLSGTYQCSDSRFEYGSIVLKDDYETSSSGVFLKVTVSSLINKQPYVKEQFKPGIAHLVSTLPGGDRVVTRDRCATRILIHEVTTTKSLPDGSIYQKVETKRFRPLNDRPGVYALGIGQNIVELINGKKISQSNISESCTLLAF
jgi:hypothetical protein